MLFNSFAFPVFLTAVAVIFYVLPHRYRWVLLVVASASFYALLSVAYLGLLLVATLVAYGGAIAIDSAPMGRRRRTTLGLAVIIELSALLTFKYFDFFAGSVNDTLQDALLPRLGFLVPAGLSFYTFSCVSYLVDVYRQKLGAEWHPGKLLLYVAFFPKLLAGPIERATSFLPQLERRVHFSTDGVAAGLQLILWGLFKKVVIADRLADLVSAAYQSPGLASPVDLLLATYFFAFQIYCDFSGYSDIAIGAARVLGFDLMENFRRPYLATSVVEFWSGRWHISLMRWFRDYLYIPMGGSRVSRPRWYFNVLAVYLISGLWHGANWTFVVWGGLNGLYAVAYLVTASPRARLAALVRLPRGLAAVLSALLTFHLILIGWVFFRAASLSDAVTLLSRVAQAVPQLPALLGRYPFSPDVLLSIGLIAFLLVVELIDERRPLWERLRVRPTYVRWSVYYALLAGLLTLGSWNLTRFVYMQF